MLRGIRRIRGMEGAGKNGMTRHMLPPIIKGNTPRIRIGVIAKTDQLVPIRTKLKPSAVVGAHWPVGSFDLTVMKNRLAKQQVAIWRPNKVMQSMMRIFSTKARE